MISQCLRENDVLEHLDIRNIGLIFIGGNGFSEEVLNKVKERQLTTACRMLSD
jgi:hypothetical protein